MTLQAALHSPWRLPVPGPAFGPYPERTAAPTRVWLDGLQGRALPAAQARRRHFVAEVRSAQESVATPGSAAFTASLAMLRAKLGARGLAQGVTQQALAHVVQAAQAGLGLHFFDTQVLATRVLLDNRLAEMATGEGKTLAVMAAAATAALAGVPVHVVTANPYLAQRDAQALAPVYQALGLRVAAVVDGASEDSRRHAWRADVVYTTARELIFDYLRDRLRPRTEMPLLRGLCMALIDEADSVLIDEARTPFVLATERHDDAASACRNAALALAHGMQTGTHCTLQPLQMRVELTAQGRDVCDAAGGLTAAALWAHQRHRVELVETALAALHLYRRDVHYLITAQGVEIIDPTSGRVAEGRRWEGGLHQLIERLSGVPPSPLQQTLAQLSFQRFFPRYWRLAGTSGTLHEAARELRHVYGLAVQRVPLRVPCRRVHAPLQLFASGAARWSAVVQAVAKHHAQGAPVLVACETLADADLLSRLLQEQQLSHQRLDARQDHDEARRVAQAGERGAITVATRLAGRGTDIRLGDGVAQLGGLQVIDAQASPSPRIDRQLHGRCARGGDPGAVQQLLALDEGLLRDAVPACLRRLLQRACGHQGTLPSLLARALHAAVQWLQAAHQREQRSLLRRHDQDIAQCLGFGARIE